jgi:hypothetical protein
MKNIAFFFILVLIPSFGFSQWKDGGIIKPRQIFVEYLTVTKKLTFGVFTMPMIDGATGQGLVTDGHGRISWGTFTTPTELSVFDSTWFDYGVFAKKQSSKRDTVVVSSLVIGNVPAALTVCQTLGRDARGNVVTVPGGVDYPDEGVPYSLGSGWGNSIDTVNLDSVELNIGRGLEYINSTLQTSVNNSVQSLSGTTPSWDMTLGINATLTISDNTTITLSNCVAGISGNLTVTNPATVYTLTFSGYTNKISPSVYDVANKVLLSGGSKIDVFSWYYDGTYLLWNGTNDYQ